MLSYVWLWDQLQIFVHVVHIYKASQSDLAQSAASHVTCHSFRSRNNYFGWAWQWLSSGNWPKQIGNNG